MGNICNKASRPDVFSSSAGRPLNLNSGPGPPAATSTFGGAIKPPSRILLNNNNNNTKKPKPKVVGPGQTLGGVGGSVSSGNGNGGGGGGGDAAGARQAAAEAAEVREQALKAAAKKGPLSAKLEAQKRQQIQANRGQRGISVDDALVWD